MKTKIQLVRMVLPVVYFLVLIVAAIILGVREDEEKLSQLAISATMASYCFSLADLFTTFPSSFYGNDELCKEFNSVSKRFFDDSFEIQQKVDDIFKELNGIVNSDNNGQPSSSPNSKKIAEYRRILGKVYKRSSGEGFRDEGVPRSFFSINDKIELLNKISKLLIIFGFSVFAITYIFKYVPPVNSNSSLTVVAFAFAILCFAFKNPQCALLCMRLREHHFNRIIKNEHQICADVEKWLAEIINSGT